MKLSKLISPILVVFASAILFACGNQPTETATEKSEVPAAPTDAIELTAEQAQLAGIRIGNIEERALSGSIALTGMLDVPPQQAAHVTAPFGGFLRSTTMLQGMRVSKGDLLGIIENPEYVQLQQEFLDTRGQVEFLQAEYDRQQALAKENVNAQKTLQKAVADLTSVKARNNGLRAKLRMIFIDPDKLSPDGIKSSIELRAPISGYITQIYAVVGSFVNPTDPIFRIVDTAHLHAELTAFEKDIPRLRVGQKIRFVLTSGSDEMTAKIYLIGREISAERTVRVHGHLDKDVPNLIPGMFLNAIVETGESKVPALPDEAVVNFDDKNFIFILEGTNPDRYRMVEVVPGMKQNGFTQITLPAGIEPSSRAVVQGAYKLLSKVRNAEIE